MVATIAAEMLPYLSHDRSGQQWSVTILGLWGGGTVNYKASTAPTEDNMCAVQLIVMTMQMSDVDISLPLLMCPSTLQYTNMIPNASTMIFAQCRCKSTQMRPVISRVTVPKFTKLHNVDVTSSVLLTCAFWWPYSKLMWNGSAKDENGINYNN